MDFKIRGLEFKSRWVQNNGKKNWGVRSRDKVRDRGSIGRLVNKEGEVNRDRGAIGIGSGLVMSTLFLLRNTPRPAQKKT